MPMGAALTLSLRQAPLVPSCTSLPEVEEDGPLFLKPNP